MRDYSYLRPGLPLLWLSLLAGASVTGCTGGVGKTPGGPAAEAPDTPARFACVHFEDLRRFLPATLEGLPRSRDAGSTGRYGDVSVSEAERSYSRGEEREVKVRIVDTTLGEKLGRAIVAAAEEGRGRAGDEPTAPIFWKDREAVGFVRYDPASSTAEASLLVGARYVVAVSSRGFPGTGEVRRVAQDIDLKGLAQLARAPGLERTLERTKERP